MKILLISDNRYPDGDAGAVREHVIAKMLISSGHKVYRVGRFCKETSKIEEIKCFSVPDKGKNSKGNLLNLLFFNMHIKKIIKQSDLENKYDAFFITGLKARLVKWIKKYAMKKNIKLIYNSVEYYSHEQFKYGRFARQFITNRKIALKIIDSNFRVVCISSFLKELFERKEGIRTVRIPFVLDVFEIKNKNIQIKNERLELSYVGRPGKGKDYIKNFVEALEMLTSEELKKIRLTIVGVNKEELIRNFNVSLDTLKNLGDSIDIKGLLSRDDAMIILSKSDFTVLYRSETEVYAKAGFPTKVTESLANGIPVITNKTSDLGMYIEDRYNGFIIDDKNSITSCYRKAIQLSSEELEKMKKNARYTAENKLDMHCFERELNDIFLD